MQTGNFLTLRIPMVIALLAVMTSTLSSCCFLVGISCDPTERQYKSKDSKSKTAKDSAIAKTGKKKEVPAVKGILSTMEAGTNLSFARTTYEHKYEPGVGFYYNAGSSWAISRVIYINPSIGYSRINAVEKQSYVTDPPPGTDPPVYNVERESKYHYDVLSLPVLAEYKINRQLLIYAGPSVSYVIGAKMKTGNSNRVTNIIDNTERWGMNIHAGLKYKFYSNGDPSKFGLRLGYDQGLTTLSKNGNGSGSPDYRMRGIRLGVSYNFCNCH